MSIAWLAPCAPKKTLKKVHEVSLKGMVEAADSGCERLILHLRLLTCDNASILPLGRGYVGLAQGSIGWLKSDRSRQIMDDVLCVLEHGLRRRAGD